ncbi:hypothetical protein ACJX0J_006099, partial [Zea mays]
ILTEIMQSIYWILPFYAVTQFFPGNYILRHFYTKHGGLRIKKKIYVNKYFLMEQHIQFNMTHIIYIFLLYANQWAQLIFPLFFFVFSILIFRIK